MANLLVIRIGALNKMLGLLLVESKLICLSEYLINRGHFPQLAAPKTE